MIKLSSPDDFRASDIPTEPGVYLYRNEADEIIYVGKAKNLRNALNLTFQAYINLPRRASLYAISAASIG
jgi:excinuclease ABC subunit C